uniref:CSON001911 protein n=1 Tax=Culicoides sonorensis TaxID=179676 RepID=A0A336KZF2_CULSO
MPKKQPKNAYFFFMLEYKRVEEARGRRFPGGLKEVSHAASSTWKEMSPSQRERFELLAKIEKQKDRKHGERYTSQGRPISEVRREEEEKRAKEEAQKQAVVKLIQDAVRHNKLDTNPFYILSFNYFLKEPNNLKYYPCELGIVRFSIANGITKKYHSLINPGTLPLGYRWEITDHHNKTHKLPIPPHALGEEEYEKVLQDMLELFCEERSAVEEVFPILVLESEMHMAECILNEFLDKAELEYDAIQILPLTYFFHKLRVAVDKIYLETESQFSFAIAMSHLERDQYQYYQGNGCKFHEKDDVNIHCALSRPTRNAYYIIDQTISLIGGKKKVGYHYPKGCIIDEDEDVQSDENNDEKDYKPKYEKYSDDDNYTEEVDLKVTKHEFSDDEESTTVDYEKKYRRKNGTRHDDDETISTLSSKYVPDRRTNGRDRNRDDDYDTDRSYATTSTLSSRVTNPFRQNLHRDQNHRNRNEDDTDSTISSRYERHSKEKERDRQTRGFEHCDRTYASAASLSTTRSTNPFHKDNFPALGAVPKYSRRDSSDSSDHSSDRRSTHKEIPSRSRKSSERSAGYDRRSNSLESQKIDPRLRDSDFTEKYLKEKYEKLKAELALLDKVQSKRKGLDEDRHSSKRGRSRSSSRERNYDSYRYYR